MDHNDQATIADQRKPIPNISKGRNQARRERDRARRNRLTTEQKEEINARRRAEDRTKRSSLTDEQKKDINARRRAARQRASTQTITDEKRATLLAQRRSKDAARRNTPCAESIAMPCPNAIALPLTTHASSARGGTASPPASPSTSMPEYTIRTDGNTRSLHPLFIYYIYVMVH
jgi:hypothetical protein